MKEATAKIIDATLRRVASLPMCIFYTNSLDSVLRTGDLLAIHKDAGLEYTAMSAESAKVVQSTVDWVLYSVINAVRDITENLKRYTGLPEDPSGHDRIDVILNDAAAEAIRFVQGTVTLPSYDNSVGATTLGFSVLRCPTITETVQGLYTAEVLCNISCDASPTKIFFTVRILRTVPKQGDNMPTRTKISATLVYNGETQRKEKVTVVTDLPFYAAVMAAETLLNARAQERLEEIATGPFTAELTLDSIVDSQTKESVYGQTQGWSGRLQYDQA